MLTLACAAVILTRLPLEDLGVRLDSVGALSVGVLVVGVPLALLAAALQVAAATHARTFKEGQTYLSMLLFLPMFTGMLSAFSHAQPAPWRLAVPVLGQHQLLAAVLRGDAPGVPHARGAGGRRARHHRPAAAPDRHLSCRAIASSMGEDKDFERVLAEFGPALRRLAGSYEPDAGRRDDLAQEIAIALWRALPRFRGECSMRTFVYRIAHNRALTHVWRRGRTLTTEVAEAEQVVDPAESAESRVARGQRRAPPRRRYPHAADCPSPGPDAGARRLCRTRRSAACWAFGRTP